MKLNKWTMALAAAGVVSLSSVAQAQEAAAGANALAASTTLSGYVSTSYTINDTAAADDAFNLDVVDIKLASAQGAGEYATGYTVELWAGPNAGGLGTGAGSDTVELYQANIDVRLPVGNGLDIKIGQFGTVVGAESNNYTENAFYTRSRAFNTSQPTHHTGALASYQLSDDASVSVGFVNDTTTNTTNAEEGTGTAYLVSLSYTLPESTGFLGGTELTYGRVDGAGTGDQDNQYVGVSLPLPVEGLSYNFAYDLVEYASGSDSSFLGHYLSYAANDKTTINLRYETGNDSSAATHVHGIQDLSIGVDYQLWENVISRVEWIQTDQDGGTSDESLVFNVIYSF